ncbi:NADP-dependent phosphogluconate dehydrogenase [Aerococcus sp. HMSC10H05]|uniref:NADP-dependent phosphogluconate dehydrogenase n=1 Tax=Aerococcus sp. HMSC10H05 TaxID=1581084 RepID=UPI0008A33DBD|nr:NADP-dependent phosphogluconate dehydrogenase [Aerococcus sp. HMSC10H05]OFU51303.1 phosphogluconate dehydrogenase (NADP(+)-dependent, decarboxylating) [Aerococcus sp. HMSC10H05]
MTEAHIGVVGMAVMGKNLALNIESRGYTVAVFNRTTSKAKAVVDENPDKNLVFAETMEAFVNSLEKPRRILLMVQAGKATDATISQLMPLLDKDDVIIDGGNTFFQDTIRRSNEIDGSGIHFIGMGVSGGEEGALKGPSLMPGGPKEAYDIVEPILKQIAAKAPSDGEPCVTYIGPNGAGHYVKMVHNGIEYGDMQLIAETYDLLRRHLDLPVTEIAEYFAEWNTGELDSFLIEITADILTKHDPKTGKPMVDVILDRAGNKGTGKWTSQSALDVGVPLQTITESVYARYISALKDQRVRASKVLAGPENTTFEGSKEDFVEKIRKALYFSKIMSYAQGFYQYRTASEEYDWNLNYKEIAAIFRAGCIIRAGFLEKIMDAYENNADLENILLDEYFMDIAKDYQQATREVAAEAIKSGIPVPGFTSALSYYDSYRSETLPANIIQAQRDYFGAHTYERVDAEGSYHLLWDKEEQIDA